MITSNLFYIHIKTYIIKTTLLYILFLQIECKLNDEFKNEYNKKLDNIINKNVDYTKNKSENNCPDQIEKDLVRYKPFPEFDYIKEKIMAYTKKILLEMNVEYFQGYGEIVVCYIFYYYIDYDDKTAFFEDKRIKEIILKLVSNVFQIYCETLIEKKYEKYFYNENMLQKAINKKYNIHETETENRVNYTEQIFSFFARSVKSLDDWYILNDIILGCEDSDILFIIAYVFYENIKGKENKKGIKYLENDKSFDILKNAVKNKMSLYFFLNNQTEEDAKKGSTVETCMIISTPILLVSLIFAFFAGKTTNT